MKHAMEKAVKNWEYGTLVNYVMQFFNTHQRVSEKQIKKALEYRGISNVHELAGHYKKETYFGAAKAFYCDYMCLREYQVGYLEAIKKGDDLTAVHPLPTGAGKSVVLKALKGAKT